MPILHYNNDYVNSPMVDPRTPLCVARPGSFSHCHSYLVAFYLLWFRFVSAADVAVVAAFVVDSFEDNL